MVMDDLKPNRHHSPCRTLSWTELRHGKDGVSVGGPWDCLTSPRPSHDSIAGSCLVENEGNRRSCH